MSQIPFRADIVGSFLRPAPLKSAREDFKAGKIQKEDLLKVENEEVVKLISKLVSLGLKDVTDGEFKRSMWHLDFQTGLQGVKFVTYPKSFMHTAANHIDVRPDGYEIVGKVQYNPNHPFFDSFIHLKSVVPAGVIPKATIPSPCMFLGFNAVPPPGYKNLDELIDDIAVAYNLTIKRFYELGCRYLQIDDCVFPSIGSRPIPGVFDIPAGVPPPSPERVAAHAANCVKAINNSIKDLPADFTITMHCCKGNYCSDFFGNNPYDTVVEHLAKLNVNGFFLEYDDERSGGFEPLAMVAANGKNQRIVLGLITSKRPALEREEEVIARIDEAAKYFPKDRLAISAQCGFASCEEGNKLTEEEQFAKISLIVNIAKKVWGSL